VRSWVEAEGGQRFTSKVTSQVTNRAIARYVAFGVRRLQEARRFARMYSHRGHGGAVVGGRTEAIGDDVERPDF
jgi:hypothetical protein